MKREKELVLRGRQATGGLWTVTLEGTIYRGSGGTLREAFDKLLEAMFEVALEHAVREAERLEDA